VFCVCDEERTKTVLVWRKCMFCWAERGGINQPEERRAQAMRGEGQGNEEGAIARTAMATEIRGRWGSFGEARALRGD
jgi:hypothetical protein